MLRPLVGSKFQVLFHSLLRVLFTFPSRYLFTIGRYRVFSLTRWSAWIHAGFHLSRITQGSRQLGSGFDYRVITFFDSSFQKILLPSSMLYAALLPQWDKSHWFGLFPVRSPLLGESLSLSFPLLTEMFHFSRFASRHYVFIT